MSENPEAAPAAPVRRKRRWLRRVLWGFLFTLILLWMVKVPLTNWALRRLPGDWEITVTGLRPGFFGATLKGVRVVHRPTGRQLGFAQEVEANNGWGSLLEGKLGDLTLTQAEVSWREEFEKPYKLPPEGGPPASPLLEWEKARINGGVFTWYELGREVPRLSLRVTGFEGGKLTIYNDGRLEAADYNLKVDEVVSREFTDDGALEIESSSPHVEGVVTAQRALNRYTVETAKVAAPQVKVIWRRGATASAAPTPPETPGPPRPAWDKPVEFFIKEAAADPGRVLLTLHSPTAAPADFTAALTSAQTSGLRAGGGQPFVIAGAAAKLTDLKSPGTTMEAKELEFTGSWDERSRIHVTSATVNGAVLTDSNRLLASLGFSAEDMKSLPVCRTGLDANCVNLLISAEGISSPDPQHFVLQDFSAQLPGEKVPLAKAPRVEISAVPGEAINDKRLRSLVAEKPELKIQKSQIPPQMAPFPTISAKPPVVPSPDAPPEKPAWFGWRADSLTVKDGSFEAIDLGTGIPDSSGNISVQTGPRETGGESLYQIHVDNVSFMNPVLKAIPFRTGGIMEIDVHPERLWRDEAIEEVRVNGHRVELNEAFIKLFEGGDEKKNAPPAAAEQASPDKPMSSWRPNWKIRRLVIDDTDVIIDDIGDGRKLVVPIRGQVFENVPLTAGMMEHDSARTVQKVEVPAVYLYAPFNEGVTVAELPVNWIYFSFAGLLQKRLERVELINPKLKAGKPFFQFIEVAGKRFSGMAKDTAGESDHAAAAAKFWREFRAALVRQFSSGKAAPVAPPAAKPVNVAVWDIPFFTETGMVITAPKGVEWTQIPRLPFRNARVTAGPDRDQPIPFRLHGSEAHGELAIVPGWYEFKKYNLLIRLSDECRVVFNFPLKEKNNNLVEIFRNNTIIYRHLKIDKVWLSVTYDSEGIYVGFGGETGGGYINGTVNLYTDDLYSWDGSVSFTGLDAAGVTGKLTREYVLMEGRVDNLNVTAYGDMTGLYQTTVALRMSRSGRLQIKALDALRRRFTDNRKDWGDDFGRIAVDALRDFSFASCEGSARLFGHEGKVSLNLKGPAGSRDFTINLRDYRHRPEKAIVRF